MKASYITAVAMMFIPLGVVVLIEKPEWDIWAKWFIALGIISFIVGWVLTIRYERQQYKEYKQRQKEREDDNKRREEMHHLEVLIQYEILRKLGVNPRRVNRHYERWLEEHNLKYKKSDDDWSEVDKGAWSEYGGQF